MATISYSFLFVIIPIHICIAQTNMTPQDMANYQNTVMIEALNLTEIQILSVKDINLEYAIKQNKLIKEEGSMLSKFGNMKKIKKQKNKELKNVLTNEQFNLYEDKIEPKIRKYLRKHISY